jgi:hypothetical protein
MDRKDLVEKIDRINDDLWKLSKDIDNSGLILPRGSRSVVQAINNLKDVAEDIKKCKRRERRKVIPASNDFLKLGMRSSQMNDPRVCHEKDFPNDPPTHGMSKYQAKKQVVFASNLARQEEDKGSNVQELLDESLEKVSNKMKRNLFLSCEPSSSKERLLTRKDMQEAVKQKRQFCLDGNKIRVKKPEGSGNGTDSVSTRKGSSKIFFQGKS